MRFPETGNLYVNVQNNNKIAWKNISIVDTDGDGGRYADVVIGNFGREPRAIRLVFESPKRRPTSLFEWGYVLVEFHGVLRKWCKGVKGEGFEQLVDGRLVITYSGAQLQGPPLKPGEFGNAHVRFIPDGRRVTGTRIFELDVTELNIKGNRLGGQRILLRTAAGCKRPKGDNQLGTFDGVAWNVKGKGGCGCGC
jgi:hypothetical protein